MSEFIHPDYTTQERIVSTTPSSLPSQDMSEVKHILIHPEGAHRIGRALQSKFAMTEPFIRSGLTTLENDPSVIGNERYSAYVTKITEQLARLSGFVTGMQTAEQVEIETDGHYERIVFPALSTIPDETEEPVEQNNALTPEMIRLVATTVAHEGRTPSTSIKGYVELLKRKNTSPVTQLAATQIVSALESFSGIVTEISKEIELESMTAIPPERVY